MKTPIALTLLAAVTLTLAHPSHAQPPRTDVIWARSVTPGTITLDGVLNEPAWNLAESAVIRYGINNGDPGSGWKAEGGLVSTDSTNATIRWLREGNQLFMAATVPDISVGGSEIFNRFDGFLMAISNHSVASRPTPPMEHFYSWWWPTDPNARDINKEPSFIGAWGNNPPTVARTATQIANWNAVTVVNGKTNSDTLSDAGYTVEMRFNVAADGYNYTDADGDIVEFNMSIYDCDKFWPLDPFAFSSTRAWWQGPWGNVHEKHQVKIFGRNDVTTASGPVPAIGPDLRIPNAGNIPAPTIDGLLNEAVWQHAASFDIRYNDATLRNTYPSTGPFRSGQFQTTVNGSNDDFVANPGDATIKWFYKGDRLYIGFDVRDEVVQNPPAFDRKDGFLVTINEKVVRNENDNDLQGRRLGWHVADVPDHLGYDIELNYLPTLKDNLNGAAIALKLKPGTTIDTLGVDTDAGYTAEMWIDLTKLGFPPGLGDRILWIGLNLLDGDSYIPFTDSYGTRTWFFREYEGTWCPAWAYLDPALFVLDADGPGPNVPARAQLNGNYPNPFTRSTTVNFALAQPSRVTLEVFDLQGRMVGTRALGVQSAGPGYASFSREGLTNGLYLYRLRLQDPASGALRETLSGRMTVVR